MRRVTTLALLLAVAGVAAGCGSDSKQANTYVAAVQDAQRAYVTGFDQALARLTPTSTLPQDRATLADFAGLTGRFSASLRHIKPPKAVTRQHAALVRVVARFGAQLTSARARLARGSAADRAVVRTQLSSSVQSTQSAVAKAVTDINQALHQ